MNVTIKDVAKAAGVSVATVSRVLNNSAAVSEASAEQVNNAIKELGYSPNFLGRNLRKCETNVILGIVPSIEQSYYSPVIHGMQDKAAEYGYDILITTSNSDIPTEMRLLNMVFNRTVDAAVLLGTHIEAALLDDLVSKYNIALCCEKVEGAKVLSVSVDNKKASYDAVKYLISKGHRRIGMISTSGRAPSSVDREFGYKRALEESGIAFDESLIVGGDYDYTNGADCFRRLMELKEPPTAVFCISDLLAIGAIKQAAAMGYNVGKGGKNGISVMGFDNILLSGMFMPGVTTVAQPCYDMGSIVVDNLISNISGHKHFNENITLGCEIIERESVADIS